MTNRSHLLAFMLAVFLVQLGVPISMIARRERTLATGEAFKFRTEPVDPVDVFRGRYVQLGFDRGLDLPNTGHFVNNQRVYVSIETGTNGFASLTGVFLNKPAEVPSFRTRVLYTSGAEVTVEIPFDRYYMNETLAPEAERAYRENSRTGKRDAYVVVRVKKGMAVIEELYVGDLPITDFVLKGK